MGVKVCFGWGFKTDCRPNGLMSTRARGRRTSVQTKEKRIVRPVKIPKKKVGRKLAKTLEANPNTRIIVVTTIACPIFR